MSATTTTAASAEEQRAARRTVRARRVMGYRSPEQRQCCASCGACRFVTGADDEVTSSTPVHCDVGDFPVERGGLCYAWRKAS